MRVRNSAALRAYGPVICRGIKSPGRGWARGRPSAQSLQNAFDHEDVTVQTTLIDKDSMTVRCGTASDCLGPPQIALDRLGSLSPRLTRAPPCTRLRSTSPPKPLSACRAAEERHHEDEDEGVDKMCDNANLYERPTQTSRAACETRRVHTSAPRPRACVGAARAARSCRRWRSVATMARSQDGLAG